MARVANSGTLGAGGAHSTAMALRYQVAVDSEQASRDIARVAEQVGATRINLRKAFGGSLGTLSRRPSIGSAPGGALMQARRSPAAILATAHGRVEGRVEEAMVDAMREGSELQKKAIDAAVTGWGIYRFSKGRGGSAGRNLTGAMIAGVTWNVEKDRNVRVTPTGGNTGIVARRATITGWHGWPDGVPDYFRMQEQGFNHKSVGITISGIAGTPGRGVAFTDVTIGGSGSSYVEGARSLAASVAATRGKLLSLLRGAR